MSTNNSIIRFIHISDSHITESSNIETINLVNYINNLPCKIDFIFHTGDIVGDSSCESYKLAKEIFSKSIYPIYFAPGNYEIVDYYREFILNDLDKVCFLSDYSYYININNYRIVSLDTTILDKDKFHGELKKEDLVFLNKIISDRPKLIIFLHFPVVELDSVVSSKDLCLINGELLHNFCKQNKEKIIGVFYGHVHRGMTIYKDEILYSSVGSVVNQYHIWPNTLDLTPDNSISMRCNLVTINNKMVIIKELATSSELQ